MALYLNLYHEIQTQEMQRRRDPLKIGIAVMSLIATLLLCYYFWRLQTVHGVKGELARVKSHWTKAQEKQTAANARIAELNQTIRLAEAFKSKIEGRVYWAPILERIIRSVPSEIQITKLQGVLSTEGTKRVTVNITGIATGTVPRTVAEQLRTSLYNKFSADYSGANSTFKSLEDGAETVFYHGANSPTALFSIELTFNPVMKADNAKKTEQPQPKKT